MLAALLVFFIWWQSPHPVVADSVHVTARGSDVSGVYVADDGLSGEIYVTAPTECTDIEWEMVTISGITLRGTYQWHDGCRRIYFPAVF